MHPLQCSGNIVISSCLNQERYVWKPLKSVRLKPFRQGRLSKYLLFRQRTFSNSFHFSCHSAIVSLCGNRTLPGRKFSDDITKTSFSRHQLGSYLLSCRPLRRSMCGVHLGDIQLQCFFRVVYFPAHLLTLGLQYSKTVLTRR